MTLDDGVSIININPSIEWVNEFEWSPVTQELTRTIGGSLIVEESALTKGRPFTFSTGSDVWVDRSVVKEIEAKFAIPGKQFTMTLVSGEVFTVIPDHSGGSAFTAKPVLRQNVKTDTHDYNNLTLKLMEI